MASRSARCSAWLFLILGGFAFFPQTVGAQLKIPVDEEVKLFYLGEWRDGVVVESKGREYLVEYVFVNSRRDVFTRDQLRRLYEFQGMDYGRKWKSDNGEFEIEASLLKIISDDKIALLKPDLTELEVPLSRLSSSDQSYVNKFKRQFERAVASGLRPAPMPEMKEIETFSNSTFGGFDTFSSETSPLQPFGKVPSYLREFKHNGVGFRLIREDQELRSIVAVGGPDQWILVGCPEDDFFTMAREGIRYQSQLYWLSMKQNKVTKSVALPPEHLLLDYDPRTRRLLTTYRKGFGRRADQDEPTHMALWSLDFGDDNLTAICRWSIEGMSSKPRHRDVTFGKVISDELVLTQMEDNQYVGWNVKDKAVAFTIETKSFFGAPVRLTEDRRFLIVPEDGQVSVFDVQSGKLTMRSKVNARHVSGANVNPDGTRLAAVTEKEILVWDLEAGQQEPTVYPAPLIANPFRSRIDWIDNERVLLDGVNTRTLFSLKLGIPLWSYKTSIWMDNRNSLENFMLDGIFFYTDQESGNVAVGAVELPGPAVDETTANIDPESLLAVKPGSRVAIELNNVDSAGDVEQWLKEKIEANGWVFDSAAEIVLQAEMGVGQQRTIEYTSMGGFRSDRDSTRVTYTPHYSRLKLIRGSQVLWQSGTSTGAPPIVHGNQQQIQNEINGYQRPNVGFFKSVVINPKIIDPKYSRGFGESSIGRRGIVVESTNPPGRADDPNAAAEELQKELEKQQQQRDNPDSGESGSGQ